MDVLSTNRLYQILEELNRQDDRVTSLEVIQEVSDRADVETVVLGSFMKAGENIRINLRVQDATSGDILTTEKIEGVGESSIFSMVDDLTRRIKTNFEIPAAAEADRQLQEVTTSSMEAYRYYLEAVKLNRQGKPEEAILLAEKAVELDPTFASALIDLSIFHWNLGNQKEYEEFGRQALEHVDRVTERERLYIEATYYTNAEGTYDRGLPIIERAVELYPKDIGFRNDLAVCYRIMERFEEAVEQCEARARLVGPALYCSGTLADSYTAIGQVDKGLQAIEDFVRAHPDNPDGHLILGRQLVEMGRLDEALAAFRKAESLDPSILWLEAGRSNVFILREEWEEARAAAERTLASSNHEESLTGSFILATIELYRGDSKKALQILEEAAGAHPDHRNLRAAAKNYEASVLLQKGEPGAALALAETARVEGEGDLGEWEALYFAGLARAKLAQWNEADRTADLLWEETKSLPTEKEKRRLHHLKGELALAKGETDRAVDELTRAQSMLAARGSTESTHVPIWFSLGSAHLAAGNDTEAAKWFVRVIDSTTEHIDWPIPYVRSYYFLGKIHENRGDMDKAREYYQRFVEFWKDGDLDRERVEEALTKL
jgi:tetratricopeptide (TPR) repeat protein